MQPWAPGRNVNPAHVRADAGKVTRRALAAAARTGCSRRCSRPAASPPDRSPRRRARGASLARSSSRRSWSSNAATGKRRNIALVPARTIAADLRRFSDRLESAGDRSRSSAPVPQEVADVTLFNEDRRPAAYDPAKRSNAGSASSLYYRRASLKLGRAHFFGRSGIQLWWGAFDLALLLFNGKHAHAAGRSRWLFDALRSRRRS